MKKRKNGQLIIIGVLSFAILFMSVGFATYSQTLNIQGTATVNVIEWNIHWKTDSLSVQNDSVSLNSSSLTNTDVSFSGTLTHPGDKIHFKVTAYNEGDLDAYLKKITMTSLSDEQKKYLSLSVKFDNVEYLVTTDNLTTTLLQNAEKDAEVTVTYFEPANQNDLPTENVQVNIDIHFDFEQKVN